MLDHSPLVLESGVIEATEGAWDTLFTGGLSTFVAFQDNLTFS